MLNLFGRHDEDFSSDPYEDVSIFSHWLEPAGACLPPPREVVREVIKPDLVWIYPGSFCPPTYGHLRLIERAAEIFPKLRVVCSSDPEKHDRWFTMEECKEMWESYEIPTRRNFQFQTLHEFVAEKIKPSRIAIIRGIRNDSDWEREKQVAILNQREFGITRYFYLLSENEYEDVSSSRVRVMAENLEIESLHRFVSPLVISALLEKVLRIQNLFLVVGKPGAGKSTFLDYLQKRDAGNVWINSDEITRRLKARLEEQFPGQNLLDVVRNREDEVHRIIGRPWIEGLKEELKGAAGKKNVFVEIPYGLQKNKQMFRFVGGKVLYLGCDERETRKRIIERGTPELLPFAEKIPGLAESRRIAEENKLFLEEIDTGGSLEELCEKADEFCYYLGFAKKRRAGK